MQQFVLERALISGALFPLQLFYEVLIVHGHNPAPTASTGGQNARRGHVRDSVSCLSDFLSRVSHWSRKLKRHHRSCRQSRVDVLCQVTSHRTRASGLKLCQVRLRLKIRKYFFSERMLRHYNRLSRAVVASTFLELVHVEAGDVVLW